MNLTSYRDLVTTNGAVCVYRTAQPDLPPFAVFLTGGELLDTFTDRTEADEFADIARDRMRAGLPWPDPDARTGIEVNPLFLIAYAVSVVDRRTANTPLLPCGCYKGACYCGQYPTAAQMREMQAEAEADLPKRIPATLAEELEAEELRNFFGNPHLDN